MSQVSLEEVATKCGVSLECLDQPCSSEDILILAPFCDPWKLVGKYLKLTSSQISAIDQDNNSTDEKRVVCLEKWKECASFRATYLKLVRVFLAIEKADKAFEICRILKQQDNPCNPETSANPAPQTIHTDVASTCQTVSDKQESAKITREVRKLEREYAKVVITTIKFVRREGLTMDELSDSFVNLPPLLTNLPVESIEEKIKALPSTATTRDFFKIVQPYSDFLNPGLLEHLVNCFGDDDVEQRMSAYLNNLQIFRRQTKLADLADKWAGVTPPEYSELTLEMDEDWTQKTLEEFEKIKAKASIKKWLIKRVSVGSLIVVFSVPPPTKEDHRDVNESDCYNIDDLLEQQPLKIIIDGECVLDEEAIQSFSIRAETKDTMGDNTVLGDAEISAKSGADQLPGTIQFGFNLTLVRNTLVSVDGLNAEAGDYYGRNIYGARPLKGASEFEVEISSGTLIYAFGVMQCKRGRILTRKDVPGFIGDADNYCVLNKQYMTNRLRSVHTEYRYTSRDTEHLEKGDRVGMQLNKNGDLSFLINGKSLGIAAKGVYKKGYDVYPVTSYSGKIKVSRATMHVENLNLQELCLEEIAICLKNPRDVELLTLPRRLKDTLKEYTVVL